MERGQNSKPSLPQTPRINDCILKYYQKFGQDRDLEKYMRIYSPSASSSSTTSKNGIEICCIRKKGDKESRESVSSSGSCEALIKVPGSHPLASVCCGHNSKSMPNIDLQGTGPAAECAVGENKDLIRDIDIEIEVVKGKFLSASTECLGTPKKNFTSSDVKQTKTPESIAKSHRRLEWDSLGDIGYKKSMSTSNISVLERSLLKEFFKEKGHHSQSQSQPSSSNHENNIEFLEQLIEIKEQQQETLKEQTRKNGEHSTPPLACSTLLEINSNRTRSRGARPKMISQSTSMSSLQQKFEKYAQTSLIINKSGKTQSQEIQASLSSSNSTSVIDDSATPSSFEYRSSRSSRSSKSSEVYRASDISLKHKENSKKQSHPFITSITELLHKKRFLMEKKKEQQRPQRTKINELQSNFHEALNEDKENHNPSSSSTTLSLSRQAPELDLGIQLICSLIDAKSLNGRQKRKLIRDIVRRITRLNDFENLTLESESSQSTEKQNQYDSVYLSERNELEKGCQVLLNLSCDLGVRTVNTDKEKNVFHKSKMDNTEKLIGANKLNNNVQQFISTTGNTAASSSSKENQIAGDKKYRNYNEALKLAEIRKYKQQNISEEQVLKKHLSKQSLHNEAPLMVRTHSTETVKTSVGSESKKSEMSSSSKTTSSTATTSTKSTSSSGSSHDLPTQKSLRKPHLPIPCNVATDTQSTMGEWLNPLTQSEIEYEEKKLADISKKQKELNSGNHIKASEQEAERRQQLGWIENEIRRLEGLKHLLLKDNTSDQSMTLQEGDSEVTKETTKLEILYDTVYSDKSSVLSESAERLVKDIEYILEESNEDIINFKKDSKKLKESKNQIVNEKPQHSKVLKEKYRTVKEVVNISEERGTFKAIPPLQRKKIDTPTTSTEQSPEMAESLRDLVKQKKHDFMELYKTKKQNHYDALKQQQQRAQENNYKYKYDIPNQGRKYSGHFSVPLTSNRKVSPTEYAYPHSRLPPTPDDPLTKSSSDVVYSTAAANIENRQQKHEQKNNQSISTTSTTTTTSSASVFCVSSDVSVPMGSNNASSTPTTTHHYDDVAAAVAGVAVQTSDSVLHQTTGGTCAGSNTQLRPYFYVQHHHNRECFPQPIITNTAAIQVKPKGIAYVIEFEDTKENSEEKNQPLVDTTIVSAMLKTSSKPLLSLQDHLLKAKPKFLEQTKMRKAILNEMQAMRQARDRQLREIIENTSLNSLDRRLHNLPPPPTQKIRILKTKEMKALTNKRFACLSEVVARKQREVEERKRRGNRLLRDVFNRRLQKRVRNGKLSLNHSKTVI